MWVEAVAAGLVGLALLTLVLSPLVAGQLPERPLQDEPDELDETPRGAALLALKEIEFDQATGKLSDEDYAVLKSRYTVVALAALREGERGAENGERERSLVAPPISDVEALIARRREAIGTTGASGPSCPICGPRPEGDALYCSGCGRALEESGGRALA
jgi:hypothetical protein